MVKHPDHVHSIGMMTIEIAEMELHLARLLGRLIGQAVQVGEALYFTPKAAIPRIDFICNVAPLVLKKNPNKLKAVQALAETAKKLMGKRHNLIHNRFKVDGGAISTVRYEKGVPTSEGIPIGKLTKLVDDIRILNIKLIDLAEYGSTRDWLTT